MTTSTKTTMKEVSKRGKPELLRLAGRVCNLIAVRIINDYILHLSPCVPSTTPRRWQPHFGHLPRCDGGTMDCSACITNPKLGGIKLN